MRLSLIENLLSEELIESITRNGGLAVSDASVQFMSCCPSGFLPSAFNLGWVILWSLAIAFVAGFLLYSYRKLAVALVIGWIVIVGWALLDSYVDYADVIRRLPSHRQHAFAAHLASYSASLPVQFLFNAVIALLLPLGMGYWFARPFRPKPLRADNAHD